MNVIYDIALIKISSTHTQRVEVPRWEVPVLQVIHGNDVVITGQVIVDRAVPDPAAEFQRLATRYGPKNEKVPAVAAIYGNFGPGTTALRTEIRNSLTSIGATPDNYRSPDERKLDATKAATDSGQTIEAEAQAIEDAAATATPADSQLLNLQPATEQVAIGPDTAALPTIDSAEASKGEDLIVSDDIDEDIASLING